MTSVPMARRELRHVVTPTGAANAMGLAAEPSTTQLLRQGSIALPTIVSLLLAFFAVASAWAQSTEVVDVVDPPGRVGSISLLAGPVTVVDLNSGSREEALINWPVTAGWRLETGRNGRAEVRVGSTALRLDDETTVDFVRLDDSFMQVAVLQGSLSLRLRNRELLNELEVLTQRDRLVFEETGAYRIDVDRTPGTTAVTAFAGRVRIASAGSSFVVAAGQRGEISTTPMIRFQMVAAVADRFDDWAATRDARDDAVRSAGYVSRETTGMEALDDYGDWRTVDDYGPVWFPRAVAPNWAPYRFGRWVWVSPWGWTWIDEAPWGFAPLHYGRWVWVGGSWGWFPGAVVPRPVFAPALVAWYGVPVATVRVGAPVGWFPLGPREPYVPPFRHSPRYLRVVNVQQVPNVERITIVQTPRYVHRHPDRSTWVPDDRFGRPEPVHRGQRPPPSEWRQYIARPQPPANVPGTKRRQGIEAVAPSPPPASPAVPAEARPPERAPSVAPRFGEAPRAADLPAAASAPRAQPAPQAGRPAPAVNRSDPPIPVRPGDAPRPGAAPRPGESPRSIATPRTVEAQQAPPSAPRPESSGDRGDIPAAPGLDRRMAPRAPMPASQPASAAQPAVGTGALPRPTPPSASPPFVEAPEPRSGRGVRGELPGESARPFVRPPAAADHANPGSAAPAAPPSAVPPAREARPSPPPGRPAPPPRDTGDAGGPRPGRASPPEATR